MSVSEIYAAIENTAAEVKEIVDNSLTENVKEKSDEKVEEKKNEKKENVEESQQHHFDLPNFQKQERLLLKEHFHSF